MTTRRLGTNADRTLYAMAKERDKPIPKGRIRRTAKVGGLVGGQAARSYATKAANLARDKDGRRAAAEKRQLEAAEQIVEVLGQMKGAAMKIGQVASFIDLAGMPPEVSDRFQQKLAELRDSAPKVAFKEMRKVVEQDLGERLGDAFADFEEEPLAAASIGQVYRAELHDGRRVAVKVQYPGVASAVRADLQNLGLLLRAAKRMAPGLDAKTVGTEIRERISEELDYEHEAQAQRAIARAWRGHPFVVVPDVVTSMSRERVLVTEWVDGAGFQQVKKLPQPERDRFGEVVFRFFFGSFYRNGHFSGDPHPGNYLLLDDGRVAFLDFGLTKKVPMGHVEAELGVIRAGLEGDAEALYERLAELGFYEREHAKVDAVRLLEHVRLLQGWYAEDEEFTLSREYVSNLMLQAGDPRSDYWDQMREGTIPADALFARRMEGLTLGVLAQLSATANWHRIMREWLYGEPPSSPLGQQEAEWLRGRPSRRAA
jgi:predicted unusual protein kinase regulating ubiquinone biosynthesis (AarF/ABC1/UbiB family)